MRVLWIVIGGSEAFGLKIVAASADGHATIVDVAHPKDARILPHPAGVTFADFLDDPARLVTGATDGLYLRNMGIPTYGVSGLFGNLDDNRAHGMDERLGVKQFYEGIEFLYRLVKALSS